MPVVLFGTSERPRLPPASIRDVHQIDIWIFNLDRSHSELSNLNKLLLPSETARRSRFKKSVLANRWTAARARLRQILGSYLQHAYYEGEFVLSSYGKPYIEPNAVSRPLYFNVSHSGPTCGVAVCWTGEIGLDIEKIDTPPWEIEVDIFNECERKELASYTGVERHLAFYRGWTRKEAVIKAIGRGLSLDMLDLEVDLSPSQTRLRRLENQNYPSWTIAGLEETDDWVGAIAMHTAGASIEIQLRNTFSHFGT